MAANSLESCLLTIVDVAASVLDKLASLRVAEKAVGTIVSCAHL
jgi:hypothetical protein